MFVTIVLAACGGGGGEDPTEPSDTAPGSDTAGPTLPTPTDTSESDTSATDTSPTDAGTLDTGEAWMPSSPWDRHTSAPLSGPDGVVVKGRRPGELVDCLHLVEPSGPTATEVYCPPVGADGLDGQIFRFSDVEIIGGHRLVVVNATVAEPAASWGGTAGSFVMINEVSVVDVDAATHTVVHRAPHSVSNAPSGDRQLVQGMVAVSATSAFVVTDHVDNGQYELYLVDGVTRPVNLFPPGTLRGSIAGLYEDRLFSIADGMLGLLAHDGSVELLSVPRWTVFNLQRGAPGSVVFHEQKSDSNGKDSIRIAIADLTTAPATVARTREQWGEYGFHVTGIALEPNGQAVIGESFTSYVHRFDGVDDSTPVATDSLPIRSDFPTVFLPHPTHSLIHLASRQSVYRLEADGSFTELAGCAHNLTGASDYVRSASWTALAASVVYGSSFGADFAHLYACDGGGSLQTLTPALGGLMGEVIPYRW